MSDVSRRVGGSFVVVAFAVALWALASRPTAAQRASGSGTEVPIATVGLLAITHAEFESQSDRVFSEFRVRSGAEPPLEYRAVIRRQLLERMIRHRLLMLEAERTGAVVSDAEAEEMLKSDPNFRPGGTFSDARYQAFKTSNPAGFKSAVRLAKLDLSARRLEDKLEQSLVPAEADVRNRAMKKLGRARIEFLGIAQRSISGEYPEPRESDVLAYYRAHNAEFRIPSETQFSVAFVQQPRLPDSLASIPSAAKAWDERMRQRADSALAEARRGANFDTLGVRLGGVKHGIVARAGSFPKYWRGDSKQESALLSMTSPGLLAEPVRTVPGWMLVRVDEYRPAHVAALVEVSPEIRDRLRRDAAAHIDDRRDREYYATMRDSLRGPAYKIRYAVADTGTMDPGEPKPADLDRYYHAHLADYSSFDASKNAVVATPLAEVRDEIHDRWMNERREDLCRESAERLALTWGNNKRDPATERRMTLFREVGPIPVGGAVDTGFVGRVLSDTLADRGYQLGARWTTYPRGYLVYQVVSEVPDYVPEFEAVRPLIDARLGSQRGESDLAGAKRMFDENPSAFALGKVVHFSRLIVPLLDPLDVKLSRAEVVRYHQKHIDDFSAPELMRARHILFTPSEPGARGDSLARRRAERVLRRIRAGEDFSKLAQEFSDDAPTKRDGGDLGTFGRGVMLQEFERAAFALDPGEVSDLVRTQVGYHIIKCVEKQPRVTQPLEQSWANVGVGAAREKAEALAQARADSIYRACRTPAQARAAAAKLDFGVVPNERVIGTPVIAPGEIETYLKKMETVAPNQFYPGTQRYRGVGYVVSWVDSVTPPRTPTWEEAQTRVLAQYRREAGSRTLTAKRAEIDSMLQAGWSVDSVATLWGGMTEIREYVAGKSHPPLGRSATIDSVVFGASGQPPLAMGRTSGWIQLPYGFVRVRVIDRQEPHQIEMATAVENERRLAIERGLVKYFDDLKRRYPVRILDSDLRTVALPPLPDS